MGQLMLLKSFTFNNFSMIFYMISKIGLRLKQFMRKILLMVVSQSALGQMVAMLILG